MSKSIPCFFVFGFQLCCPRAWGKKTYDLNTTMFCSNEYVEVNDDEDNNDDDDTMMMLMMIMMVILIVSLTM